MKALLPIFLLLLSPLRVLADDVVVQKNFESVQTSASDAARFAANCISSITEAEFRKMIVDAGAGGRMVSRPSDQTKPYLVVGASKAICIRMSTRKYPILPMEVFEGTVEFSGMSLEEKDRLHRSLALQILNAGTASALIKNDRGNAYAVTYLTASAMPTKIYYHAHFLKTGEFDESKYPLVLSSPGGMSIVGRGNPSEHAKTIF